MTDRIVTLRDNSNNKVYPVGFAPAGAVTTSMYTDASITTPKLADGSVTTSKLANNSVTADKLAPGAFDIDDISDGTITSVKLADGTITSVKLADGAITPAKLGDTGWIDASSQAGLNRCFYRKVGNIVYITLESAGNKTIGASYTTVFTLPVGFRPSIDWNFVWQNISNADSRQNGWIKTSGTIELYSNTSKNYWYGSTSFPVD